MTTYVSGIWEGTLATGTFPAYQARGGAFGEPFKILPLVGGERALYDVKLTITSQDEYRKVATGELVSTVSGELYNSGWDSSTPVSGFVDDTGLVKLIFYYYSKDVDETFIGRLTSHGIVHDISGHLMSREGGLLGGEPWTWALINYYFGTLSVKKLGLTLSDRVVYIGNYRNVF